MREWCVIDRCSYFLVSPVGAICGSLGRKWFELSIPFTVYLVTMKEADRLPVTHAVYPQQYHMHTYRHTHTHTYLECPRLERDLFEAAHAA